MPNANNRAFVGVAKDNVNTALSASVAAGATTVPVVSATGITTASTIFIVDGALSESRAVTNVASNNLTVAALTNAHPGNVYVFAQTTASVGPTDYIPITGTPTFQDDINQLQDTGYRGSNVESYNTVQGKATGSLDFAGDFFADTFGYLLGCMFGAADFAGGTPNTHTFANDNATDGQPTPYIFYWFDVVNTRAYSGARLEEVTLKLDPSGLISYSCKGKSQWSSVVANPTPSFSSILPVAAWRAAATYNGSLLNTLIDAEITIKRGINPVQTQNGAQSPYTIFAGAMTVDGKATFVQENDTIYNDYQAGNENPLSFSFTQGAGASQVGLTVQTTKTSWQTCKNTPGGNGLFVVETTFKGDANTTDANTAGGGYSPCRVVLKNAKATGTYT